MAIPSSNSPISRGAHEPHPISPSVRRQSKLPTSLATSHRHLPLGPTKAEADRSCPAGPSTPGQPGNASASEPQCGWSRRSSPNLPDPHNAPSIRATRKRGRVSECDAYPDHSGHIATEDSEATQAPLHRSYQDFLESVRTSSVATHDDFRENSTRARSQRPRLHGDPPDVEKRSPRAATSMPTTSVTVSLA